MEKLFTLALCLLISFTGLTGCGQNAEEKAVEKTVEKMIEHSSGGKAEVDLKDGNMRIKTRDGEVVINADESVKLPVDFPKDIFILKGAELKMTMDMPQGRTVSFQTSKGMTSVFETYKKEMTSKGWDQQVAMNMGEGASLVYEKDDRMASITIAKDETGTMINVVLSKK